MREIAAVFVRARVPIDGALWPAETVAEALHRALIDFADLRAVGVIVGRARDSAYVPGYRQKQEAKHPDYRSFLTTSQKMNVPSVETRMQAPISRSTSPTVIA
jgi:hypothetical protein